MDSSFVAGQQLLRGNYSQYTVTGKGYFVRAGAYSKVPHAGDIIYFYSKEKGRVAHVGIVEDVKKIGDTISYTLLKAIHLHWRSRETAAEWQEKSIGLNHLKLVVQIV